MTRLAVAIIVVAVLAVSTIAYAAPGRPSYIPPDGPAGPVKTLSQIRAGGAAAGSAVTTQTVKVARVSCPSCDEATVAADFYVTDSTGTQVWVHAPNTWQATYNVKKQNFVPSVGMSVIVQGVVGNVNGQFMITMKRFGEIGHPGPTVHAYDIASGKYPSGTYAWLDPAKVLNRGRWDDGDYSWDVRDPAGGGLVHVELSPPYWGQLRLPNVGETVAPYGQVRFDPDHNWWELHPVRCWSRTECVPTTASYMRNGPPPGTPTGTNGYYEQGGPVPLWVPLSSGGGSSSFTATFAPSTNGNDWWVETYVTASGGTLAGVDARVNDGAWVGLTHESWGSWAKSMNAPAGSAVEFRARDAVGDAVVSRPYTWPVR